LQDAITHSSGGTIVMENVDRTKTNDPCAESVEKPSPGREETSAEQTPDPSHETSKEKPHGFAVDSSKNISSSAARALMRTSTRAFLNKHRDGQRFTLHIHPGCVSLLGVGSKELFTVELAMHGRSRELLIRKRTHRGISLSRALGWPRLTVRFQESTLNDLFAGQAGHLIASDVILADDRTLRIVLPDARIAPYREPLSPETPRISTGAEVQAPSPDRIGVSTTPLPSAIPADQLGQVRVPIIGLRPCRGYWGAIATRNGRWAAYVRFNKRVIGLGLYPSEHEAAYACNLAERILYGEEARVNEIPTEHEPGPVSVAYIKARVDHALQEYGSSGNPLDVNSKVRRRGRKRCVTWHGASGLWQAKLRHEDRYLSLGYYSTRFEAELAYNHAVLLLRSKNCLLHIVSPENRPAEVDEPAIQAKVAAKLRRHGYG
jgi:hypothetical protein